MATVQILAWKNIPTQVKATDDAGEASVPLDERFQVAVDALAMDEGLAGTDEYLEHWNWTEAGERAGSAQTAAETCARELDAAWPRQVPAMVAKAKTEATA